MTISSAFSLLEEPQANLLPNNLAVFFKSMLYVRSPVIRVTDFFFPRERRPILTSPGSAFFLALTAARPPRFCWKINFNP